MGSIFAGTTVLITGASRGIGAAFAAELAASGARLVLLARDTQRLAGVAERARAAGAVVDTVRLDLTAPGAVASLPEELAGRGITVDHLINNAGIGLVGRGDEADLAAQLRVLDLDVRVVTELALRLLPGMVARGRGGILNVASLGAFQGLPWLSTPSCSVHLNASGARTAAPARAPCRSGSRCRRAGGRGCCGG